MTEGLATICNAPEGLDAFLLARRLQKGGQLRHLHIARDDSRMAALAEALRFFAPEIEVYFFPAWDCLPYDRVSPRRDIMAARADVLARLASESKARATPLIVITSVNAALQRCVPQAALAGRSLDLRVGGSYEPEAITAFLVENGFLRSDSVGEPGEFALRGGIVDVFPPELERPLRLDFFGDDLESIRVFDPLTQRSVGEEEAVTLRSVGELQLDPASIERFRSGYRTAFGAIKDDQLYEAVSAGLPYPGMEHWLPLFYDGLESLFDALPGVPVTLDHQAEDTAASRFEDIADFYQARLDHETPAAGAAAPYRPLPPERLYLTGEEWHARLRAAGAAVFTPFAAPEGVAAVTDGGGKPGLDLSAARIDPNVNVFEVLHEEIGKAAAHGLKPVIAATTEGARQRLKLLLAEHKIEGLFEADSFGDIAGLAAGKVALVTLALDRGFAHGGLLLVTEQDILGERIARSEPRRRRPENFLTEVSVLQERDLVVHIDHGIGRYEGLIALDINGALHDCLKVIYQGGDKLYVPVENIDVLSRYGGEDAAAELDKLGGVNWQARKARVKARLKDMADALMKVAAARELKQVEAMPAPEGLYDEFAARFPYPETDDQLRAIEDTLEDLSGSKPMDRLICGDVGFGKTEVALRAAFVAAMSGKQVAVVVPTTLLSRQHYQTFQTRFAGLPIEVRQLSRMVDSRAQSETKKGLTDGKVDIVIGTHALLAKSVQFADLGLLIVDEEQHFGVKQKERLKALREEVHVLTLTATPIPRTLQLAMSGVKEMSLIATPPVDRLAVRTFVLPYDPVVVREAILREYHRGGQIFYVCPRVQDLDELAERLGKLVPEIKIGIAHGQMTPTALEAVMTAFYDHRYNLLLSTNIVESGLDIPSANTMILHRADMFGLAQLYQLRGRIGRSKLRGYAYLTLPPGRLLTPAAEKRLHVMQTLDSLGAGFQLASHDLDIRGAGNLLGEEQSGQLREVGIELYQQMLEEAVANARSGHGDDVQPQPADGFSPQISLGTAVLIPESYVRD
ncbi:MAG TPA: transcription-repair coupling factor, partial [Kiloniellaceae bacterium]|nr:transcription-repair coupling factor [Kiloniellaceae bacterium]